MAVISATVRMLFLLWCTYFAGLSSARTVQRPSQKAAEDVIGVAQVSTPYDVRCDLPGCAYDLQMYCLDNGVILMGSCSLKYTLCQGGNRNSLQLAKTWDTCLLGPYSLITIEAHPSEKPRPEAKEAEGETEEVKEEGVQGPSQTVGDDAMNIANLQLEQELLTDPEVKVDGGTEVKVHGNNGDRA